VPDLVGMAAPEAAGLLREVGLRAGVVRLTITRDFDRGIVFEQEPAAGGGSTEASESP
jgi:beta-lactam-binding protein with PASTA domain